MNELGEGDRTWLSDLDVEIWDRQRDRLGGGHEFANRELSGADLERIIQLVERHRLPCVLGSGPYGNLSMGIFDHSDFPGVPPEHLLSIGEKHVDLPTGFDNWGERFDWFSRFTHSDSNREMAAFYGLPSPKPRERYEY